MTGSDPTVGDTRPAVALPAAAGRPRSRSSTAVVVLLAAGAGAADVVAFYGVGRAFAGIATGNLVAAAYTAVVGPFAWTAVTAVVALLAGETAGDLLLRRGVRAGALLVGELAVLVAVAAAWIALGGRPAGAAVPVLLAALAFAMGVQSIWALRVHQTTTYFTGMLTHAVDAAVTTGMWAQARAGARQLGALLLGATLGALVLTGMHAAAALVPALLVAAALAVELTRRR